jgi:hypothetical protein
MQSSKDVNRSTLADCHGQRSNLHRRFDVVLVAPYDHRLPPLLLLVLWLSEAGGGARCAIVTSKISHFPEKAASPPGGFFVGCRARDKGVSP